VEPDICIDNDDGVDMTCHDILDSGGLPVGTMCAEIVYDPDEPPALEITFEASGNKTLVKNEFWVGENVSNVPVLGSGAADIDRFPYFWCNYEGSETWTTKISIKYQCINGVIEGYNLSVVAQSTVEETYPNGTIITGTNTNANPYEYGNFNESSFGYFNLQVNCDCSDQVHDVSCAPSEAPSISGIPSAAPTSSPSVSVQPTTTAFPTLGPTSSQNPSESPTTTDENPGPAVCVDAWGYEPAATCFLDIPDVPNVQPGWAIGPINVSSGIYNFELIGNTTGCNQSDGIVVGSVKVEFNNRDATLTYTAATGYYIEDMNFYMGPEHTNRRKIGNQWINSVDPQYFTYTNNDVLDASVPWFAKGCGCDHNQICNPDLYLLIHAKVCLDHSRRERELELEKEITKRMEVLEELQYPVIPVSSVDVEVKADTKVEATKQLGCQKSFAFHSPTKSICFLDMGFTDVWGWSNGLFVSSDSAQILDIYAGADGCDLEKGTKVGTLTIEYDGTEAVITYDTGADFWLKETHSFVGGKRLPTVDGSEIVDPELYPIVHDENAVEGVVSDTFIVSGFEGEAINVVSHATICGYYPKDKHSLDEGMEKPIRSTTSRLRGHAKAYLYEKSWFSNVATAAVRVARNLW